MGATFAWRSAAQRLAVNLVRAQNRDDHVMRSFEGPACGAFMLNERTEYRLARSRRPRGSLFRIAGRTLWKRRGITSIIMHRESRLEKLVVRRRPLEVTRIATV